MKFIAAGRVDDHNQLENIVLSPRVALAYQPKDDHNLRVTYNRAFNTPRTSDLFLDILSVGDAFGLGANFQPVLGFSPNIDIRAQGVRSETGFTFQRSADGRPEFRSPFSPLAKLPAETYIPLDDPVFTNVMWSIGRSAVMSGVQPIFEAGLTAQGLPVSVVEALSDGFDALIPQQVVGVKNVLRSLDPQAGNFVDVEDVNDVNPLKPTITQTYEVGYKGILMNRLAFSADVYHSRIKDFTGPLVVETPNVFLDATTLGASLGQQITVALADPQNAVLNQALLAFDAPDYGDISLNGLDLSFTYYLNPSWSFGVNYSFVSKDLFENVDGLGDIALNAPKNKFGASVQYLNADLGLGVGLRTRFVAGFPVRSGVYVGDLESYYTIDLNAGYDLPIGPRPRLSLTVQNLLNRKHQQFIGSPELGRLSMVRLTQTF